MRPVRGRHRRSVAVAGVTRNRRIAWVYAQANIIDSVGRPAHGGEEVPGGSPPPETLPVGVRVLPLETRLGPVGSVQELYDPEWGAHPDPLVYAHVFTVLPDRAKGWGRHDEHDDRYALLRGSIEVALCDGRPGSETFGLGCIVRMSDVRRQLMVIPAGVWHATRNVGDGEALVVDFPTRPYRHERPDKFTLPLDTEELPMRLGPGWHGH